MNTAMIMAANKINRLLTDKYLMSNSEWHPFGDLAFDLQFIPTIYHNMFSRTIFIEDPLHELMLWISECRD
jgi:hypothetical protein